MMLWAWIVIAAAVVCAVRRRGNHRLTLARDATGNESLILEGDVAGQTRALFMVDTAYAGAPVLSTSYLAVQDTCGGPRANTSERFARCVRALRLRIAAS